METVTEGGRLFAVGDVHGQSARLARLLAALPFVPGRDRLVFLGDYINRGPDTPGVIEQLLALQGKAPDTVFLLGNHEEALLRFAREGEAEELALLRALGLEATLAGYGNAPASAVIDLAFMPPAHRAFLASLRLYCRMGEYLFVHGGLPAGESPETCPPHCLLSVRGLFLKEPGPPGLTVVFGHSPAETPLLLPGKIGLDTGAAYGGYLTAVSLPDVTFYHA